MDKYAIFSRMMCESDRLGENDLYTIAAMLAEHLEATASKLTPLERQRLMDIGTEICGYARREFGAGIHVEELFPPSAIWRN